MRRHQLIAPAGVTAIAALLWWASLTPISSPGPHREDTPLNFIAIAEKDTRTFVSYVEVASGYYACWTGAASVTVITTTAAGAVPSWGRAR